VEELALGVTELVQEAVDTRAVQPIPQHQHLLLEHITGYKTIQLYLVISRKKKMLLLGLMLDQNMV
jgi:hypothetical protein